VEPFKTYLNLIENELAQLELNKQPHELYEPIRYILSLGGKRIRPVLTLTACEAFGGNPLNAKYAALAIEVFHNFTLMHDDIMDKAPLRRNKPTVHTKWNETIAILSGDTMFVYSQLLMLKSPDKHIKTLLELFNKTAIEVCEGQQLDMNFEQQQQVSIPSYINMIALKTAVLLATSLKIGAIIADADTNNCNLIYEYGKNLGIAFQLQDDILDVYGNPDKFGKQVGGDIISNKKTFLLLKALELAKINPYKLSELQNWLQVSTKHAKEKVEAITEIYNFLGIKEIAENEMKKYLNKALQSLDSTSLNTNYKELFKSFAHSLMLRQT
jgi:geranylgeranyl diphosphate synthase type II